jgi:DASH complex subunit DAD4
LNLKSRCVKMVRINNLHQSYSSRSSSKLQESPHEQQQELLLSRIITNIVRTTLSNGSIFLKELSQEKLNEAIMVMNRSLQEVNVQNMNVELVAQMFKNYQSNVLFHLEGKSPFSYISFSV